MIGITTPYHVANYGSKLQAYALQTTVENIVQGETVQIINIGKAFDRRPTVILKKLFSVKRVIAHIDRKKAIKKVIKKIEKVNVVKRNSSINSFNDFYNLSPTINSYSELKKYSQKYSSVICGSDQIWFTDCLISNYYTLKFYSGRNKIAYAASFGLTTLPKKAKKKYRNFLSEFKAVSVRESSGAKIVNELLNIENTSVVCDPTFLLDKATWDKVADKSHYKNNDEKYILCYFLGSNPEHREYVKKVAEDTGCKIKAFVHFKEFVDADVSFADEELYDVTPCDFLCLIKNAELVCTDSMHATIFSIIFETSFYVFERYANNDPNSRNTRIYSLLERTNFETRLVQENPANIENIKISSKEWQRAKKVIDEHRETSLKFLKGALLNNDKNN